MRKKDKSGDEGARSQETVGQIIFDERKLCTPSCVCYGSDLVEFHVKTYTRLVLDKLIEFVLGSYIIVFPSRVPPAESVRGPENW
jgi:hypothetical protein